MADERAAVSGENVIRPGAGQAPHPIGGYDATASGAVSGGWVKLDDKAGTIGADGVGHTHFSDAPGGGPWKQV